MKTLKICKMSAKDYSQVVRTINANKSALTASRGELCQLRPSGNITAQLMATVTEVLGLRFATVEEFQGLFQ